MFEVLLHHLNVLRALLDPLRGRAAQRAWVSPMPAGPGDMTVQVDGNISAAGHAPLPSDRLEIMRTPGKLVFDRDRLYQVGAQATPIRHDPQENYQACFSAAIRAFVDDLRSSDPFPTDRLDNLETLKRMEACYRAAGTQT